MSTRQPTSPHELDLRKEADRIIAGSHEAVDKTRLQVTQSDKVMRESLRVLDTLQKPVDSSHG
jgi:hypothetical protein